MNRKRKLPNICTTALLDFFMGKSLMFVGIQLIESFRQGGNISVRRVANEFLKDEETLLLQRTILPMTTQPSFLEIWWELYWSEMTFRESNAFAICCHGKQILTPDFQKKWSLCNFEENPALVPTVIPSIQKDRKESHPPHFSSSKWTGEFTLAPLRTDPV